MKTETPTNLDRAGKSYWDHVWQDGRIPEPVNPRLPGLENYRERCFHTHFARVLGPGDRSGQRFLEIGCARSTWLPYFAREFGFSVTGVDYSEAGCEQARVILTRAGVSGTVVQSDFYAPPAELLGRFDVVLSLGVVEHFENTVECLAAFRRFLKPGGLLITTIPNLNGSIGLLQKLFDRSVYDIHKPLDPLALRTAHEHAGLTVEECEYFMAAGWTVLNISGWKNARLRHFVNRCRSASSKLIWLLEEKGLAVKPNRLSSPYVVCHARN